MTRAGGVASVLAATPLYPPDSRVGAWLATHRFLVHLAHKGMHVSVVSLGARGDYVLDEIPVEAGCPGRTAPARRAAEADVIISHAGDGGVGLTLATDYDKPSVRMVHGHGYGEIGDADLAVFNSHSLHAASGWTGNAIVCHPPTFAADHHVDTTGDAITIINCSQDKGIKTAWRIAEQMPDLEFLGVKGGYGQQITPRAKNFTTTPTTKDMRSVWSRTRVLLAPSNFETWGMVGVEAMASGIPVIAHPTPGLRESLGDAGIFVDRDDTDGWVAELRRLEDPDEYATASARARARSAELDPTDSLDRFADAVESLVA